jgi:hypothetical protein
MKIHNWILLLSAGICHPVLAQKFNYGLTPSINMPIIGNSSISYTTNMGFGLGMYLDYKTTAPQIKAVGSINYNRLNYGVEEKNTKIQTDNFGLNLGIKYASEMLDNSSILLGFNNTQVLGATSIYQGRNNTGPKEVNIVPQFNNRSTFNFYAGFEFDLKSSTSLFATYTYAINKTYLGDFIDAQPNMLSLGLNIGLGNEWLENGERAAMLEGLKALGSDTLYFINRSCEGEMTNFQLDSILKLTYTFSAFRVISDDEITAVQKQKNTKNFAIIGSYYSSLDDIPSSGIFLLDKNLKNLDYPYPHFIRLEFDFGNNKKMCLYSLDNAARLVFLLEAELNAALN